MKQKNLDKPIFVGGIIPVEDAKTLENQGIAAVFGPGTSISEIVSKVKEIVGN